MSNLVYCLLTKTQSLCIENIRNCRLCVRKYPNNKIFCIQFFLQIALCADHNIECSLEGKDPHTLFCVWLKCQSSLLSSSVGELLEMRTPPLSHSHKSHTKSPEDDSCQMCHMKRRGGTKRLCSNKSREGAGSK